MKTTTAGFRTHLDLPVTSLATIWRITRQDEQEFYFTDHDVDLVYSGHTYKASNGYTRSAVQNNSTLSVDNLDIMGVFDSADITDTDIRAGLFDYAEIRISVVNWADLTMGELKCRRGHLGECLLTPQGWFKAEMRGMTQNLSMNIGDIFQAECRADLGDSKCKVPIRPPLRTNSTLLALGDFIRVPTDGAVLTTISGEPTQDAYENRVYECTTAGITGTSQPTYNTTIGATTAEVGVKATGVLTLTNLPTNGQTFTVGSKVYTMQTTLTNIDGNIKIGADIFEAQDNILQGTTLGSGAGTKYASAMTAHPTVDFALGAVGTSIALTAKTPGTGGNSLATTEGLTGASFAHSTLTGGIDGVILTARDSYTRHGTIATAASAQDTFLLTFSDSRAVSDWFNGGGFTFETGNNAGYVIEVRDWTAQTYATGTATFTGVPSNNQIITIGGKVYTFQTTLTNVDGHIHIGANATACALALAEAINLGAGSGTDYAAATTLHTTVSASPSAGVVTLTAKTLGSTGNSIALSEALSNATVSGATLTGGGGGINIFLDAPFPVQVGDKVRMYPGCDKRSATCNARFANILNFRGEPFVPGQDEIANYPDAN